MSSTNHNIQVSNLHSSTIFNEIRKSIDLLDENKKNKLINQVKGIFEFRIQNDSTRETEIFIVDLKQDGTVTTPNSSSTNKQADTVIIMADNDFMNVAKGRICSQKAYNLGKLKIKGQMKLATKLDLVLRQLQGKCKL